MQDSKWPHMLNQNVNLEQTDGTAGVDVVSQNMLEIAIDLGISRQPP
jgi:hypothetical protein